MLSHPPRYLGRSIGASTVNRVRKASITNRENEARPTNQVYNPRWRGENLVQAGGRRSQRELGGRPLGCFKIIGPSDSS
ncbi:hypothetical protein LIA77_01034 [Sarocladium implicatum]|nr:hypothetical protein LIA77_01034 [Sarocladium implicatum]